MLKQIIVIVLLALAAGYYFWGNGSETINPNSSDVYSNLEIDIRSKNKSADVVKEQSTESFTSIVDSTNLDAANQVADIANTVESILEAICVEPTPENCKLREDVKVVDSLFYSNNVLTNDAVSVVLLSENFQEFVNQLNSKNQDQYNKEKSEELLKKFSNLYQDYPELITNGLGCSSGICAASFSLTDSKAFKNLSARVDEITNIPNGVIYISDGYDQSGNYQARFIFSITEEISAVTIQK